MKKISSKHTLSNHLVAFISILLIISSISGGIFFYRNSIGANAKSIVNPIVKENKLPGTTRWQSPQLANSPPIREETLPSKKTSTVTNATSIWTDTVIRGYADQTSINVGGSINFEISTAQPTYNIEIYRMGWYGGAGATLKQTITGLPGQNQPVPTPDPTTGLIEANWQTSYTLTTDTTWTTGVYLAKLIANDGSIGYIIFVLRSDNSPADILYQVPLATYQAYNAWGGTSLYESASPVGRAYKVSFDRPYDREDGAGDFFSGDYNMIRFLESKGYNIKYATSVDLQTNPNLLNNSNVFLSNHHDEYWSKPMRDTITNGLSQGKNLAFFDANDVYWQIRFENATNGTANRVITCYKDATLDPVNQKGNPAYNPSLTTVTWRSAPVSRPENALLGAMYDSYFGSGSPGVSWIVANANNWVYNGTGLNNGDAIPGVVGNEYDFIVNNGLTPTGTVMLSNSPVTDIYGKTSNANGTIYQASSGAWVFDAGSIYWDRKLDDNSYSNYGADPRIQLMTQNILNTMISAATPTPTPTSSPTFTPTPTPSPTLTPTPTPSPILNGIIGYWKFDEASAWVNDCTTLTVIDSSSNNNNGKSCTAGNGPTAAVTGRLGFARNFSGTSSYVKIASASTLNFTTGQDFSYTLWFQRSGSTNSSFLLAKGAGSTGDTGYSFVLGNGTTPTANLSQAGETSRLVMKGTAITDNNWHQITVTYQRNGSGTLYQDGVKTASIDVSGYNIDLSNTKALAIGCSSGGSTCFAGLLDDVRLYNRVLSAQEAAQLAQGL